MGYSVSNSGLRRYINKLHLEKGDILLCKDVATMNYLDHLKMDLDFKVPLVYAPEGIMKLNRQDLLNLLEQLDQQNTIAEDSTISNIPL